MVNIVKELDTDNRKFCPEICTPVPTLDFPLDWLSVSQSLQYFTQHRNSTKAITCSLTVHMLARSVSQMYENHMDTSTDISRHSRYLVLYHAVQRRLVECQEQSIWTPKARKMVETVGRRPVHSLMIWVGSSSRKHVAYDQQAVLQDAPFHGDRAVVGWTVDDDMFPCRNGTTRCLSADRRGVFKRLMPLTQLGDTRCAVGWACAQRRPLRALSHALLLFDPDFVFIGDDDTYLNYDLLQRQLGHMIDNDMRTEPIVMGNYLCPKPNQLSAKGFFLGGAGYLIGQAALQRLVSHEVLMGRDQQYGYKQRHLSYEDFVSALSLAREAKSDAEIACEDKCLLTTIADEKGCVRIAVRLVDFCTHLLAGEHTCHHSDHSLSRCLFYGFRASPRGLPCIFQATEEERRREVPYMCGHIVPCNLSTHLTCHRWKPASSTDITPVRTFLTSSNKTEWTGCLPAGDKQIW
eukprot:CAMPEP_0182438590 /NCGR_PEP_ID=MMETSP1167-20130531/85879_1 /TAXON_ID=2988 /ORGANISM="Mallomonas Sp, Strain CCMP3275" /LENGTH=462 /DNA_ID=CAMNT_0024632023 /DNA_START=532 /DNA_END=1920 /DNA_ORIENTATION=-